MKKKKQILIIPLTFWSGIEQGFFGADFTAVSRHRGVKYIYNPQCFRDSLLAHMEFTLLEEYSLSLESVMHYPPLDLAS